MHAISSYRANSYRPIMRRAGLSASVELLVTSGYACVTSELIDMCVCACDVDPASVVVVAG